MRKFLAAAFLALSVANANAQALSVSPAGGTPGGASLTLQYNNAGVFGGMVGTSWDNTNRSLSITGTTVTSNAPILNVAQTWNNGAISFDGIIVSITSTASAAASSVLRLNVGAVDQHIFRKDGTYIARGSIASTTGNLQLQANGSVIFIGAAFDVILGRNAAASLRLGAADAAAPVAQTLGVQGVVAGTANTAGANWTLQGSEGTGTGAGGSIIFQTAPAGGEGSAQNAFATAVTIDSPGTLRVKGFTVANLPAAGTAGRMAYVSDQLTACPALGGTFTGGGAVVCKAFDNGTAWVHE